MLGVTDDRAKLWVDCQPVRSVQGFIETPLKERGDYDTEDGFLSIAQIANTRQNYEVKVIKWLSCNQSFLQKIFFLFQIDFIRLHLL